MLTMKYKKIRVSYNPEVTGSVNGVYSVEIKDNVSFKSEGEKNTLKAFSQEIVRIMIEFLSMVLNVLILIKLKVCFFFLYVKK